MSKVDMAKIGKGEYKDRTVCVMFTLTLKFELDLRKKDIGTKSDFFI